MANGDVERVGLEAVVEGASQFIDDLKKAGLAYDESVNRFRNAQGQFETFATAADMVAKFSKEAADSLRKMGDAAGESGTKAKTGSDNITKFLGGFAQGAAGSAGLNIGLAALSGNFAMVGAAAGTAAIGIVTGFVDAVKQAIGASLEFGRSALMIAGNYQEMEFAALAAGQSVGISQDKMREAIKGVNDAGIRYDAAAKTVATLARNNISLASATELANRSQGAAIFLNADSSDTLERMVQATISGETESLKSMGIFLNLNDVYKKYAKGIKKSTEALSEQEKVQARVDAVINNSAALMDVYNAAMSSPTKQLRTLSGRLIPELMAALGAPFLSAFSTVIGSINSFVKALTAAAQEGGSLYPILVQLGAVASIIADGFAALVGVATNFVKGFGIEMSDGFAATAESALRWGAEMVAALATGIVEGASGALTAAMQFVGGILSFWLAPGSPPKVAPNIDTWGAAAMTTYLEGFNDADFDVLEGLQGTLKSLLSGPEFANISKGLIETLGGGMGRETFLTDLAKSVGDFGSQVSDLARKQFDLADATKEVAEAEKRYSDAQKAVESGQGKVSKLTAEYNKMLRSGASKQALDAKLKEINAAEQGVTLAQEQQAKAKDDVDTAKEKADAIKEQVSLQERLVKQLVDIAKASSDLDKEREKQSKEKKLKSGALEIPEISMPAGLSDEISSKIGDAISVAKRALKDKLADIFSPLTEAFNSKIKPALWSVKLEWAIFCLRLEELWNTKVKPVVDSISEFTTKIIEMFPPEFWENFGKVIGTMAAVAVAIAGVVAVVALLAIGISILLNPITWFVAAIIGIPIVFAATVALIMTAWNDLKTKITAKTAEIYVSVSNKIYQLKQWLSDKWTEIKNRATSAWEDIKAGIAEKVSEIVGKVNELVTTVKDNLIGAFADFKKYMEDVFGKWLTTFNDTVIKPFGDALEFISSAISMVIDRIGELRQKLGNIKLPDSMSGGSSAQQSGPGGQSSMMVSGTARGGTTVSHQQQIYRQASVTVGPNYISNGMDESGLNAAIERALKRALRG